ncbi:MAG: hypothetical protein COA45_09370 [Zetaproteobacteria bacterium]|nr:MAG: hypothetical protein COA45_09370 [Zetaproteobacteria bacterium]
MVQDKEMHKLLWLWIPLLMAVVQIFLELLLPSQTLSILHSESGPHEFVQFIIIFLALVISATMLHGLNFKEVPWLSAWIGLMTLCCFYVAGEEISWGQHVLNWSTPDYWNNLNDQGETNLHNTSSWLDQKPRLILELGVIVGGLIMPLLMKVKPDFLPKKFRIIYPPRFLYVTAGIFLVLKIVDKADVLGIQLFERGSEVQELYLFYFVLLYCLELRRRLSLKNSSFDL